MTLWILDTDHISLWQRQHTPLLTKLDEIGVENIAITVITVEEQFRGRLDMVRRANSEASRLSAYGWIRETTLFLGQISQVLAWSPEAERIHGELKQRRVRIGAQDLRIAAIALACGGTVVTRNRRDFGQVPGLVIEDWS
ncbi:MAG: type II toxin-antitoxin system VapC family toxin [Alkalinema sp. RU_4_3]|nr:type II toxin-antitoxin system VapC family toxin [Alkalinema sp. RU_4_3]